MKSALVPKPFQAGLALPISLGMHAALIGILLGVSKTSGGDKGPLIDKDKVMEIHLGAVPKSAKLHRTTRAPDPPSGTTTKKTAPPPPPQQSDMAIKVEKPVEVKGKVKEKKKEKPKKPSADDAAAQRKKYLESLKNAPIGKTNRGPSSPDGIEGATGSSADAMGDPVIAAWAESVKTLILSSFAPLQSTPLKAIVQIWVDKTGRIIKQKVTQKSGDVSFDAAARQAVENIGKLPEPPADRMPGKSTYLFLTFDNTTN